MYIVKHKSLHYPLSLYCVEIYILPIIVLQQNNILAVIFLPYLAYTKNIVIRLKYSPFQEIGCSSIKKMSPKVLTKIFTLNSSNHIKNNRNKDKFYSAYGRHNLCIKTLNLLVFIIMWNYVANNINMHTYFTDYKNKSKISIKSEDFNIVLEILFIILSTKY